MSGLARFGRPASSLASLALSVLTLGVLAPHVRAELGPIYQHTLPDFIPVVGHDGAGHADPAGEVQVIVRDLDGNRMPGIPVRFDLSGCTDLHIAAVQPFPGLLVDCAGRGVTAISDADGVARFRIVGGALNPGGAPGGGFLAARVWVGGDRMPFGRTVCVFDQNGLDGLHANDMSAWLTDYAAQLLVGRSDYDGNGWLGANDLSLWMFRYFGDGSTHGAGSLPGGTCP